MSNTEAESIGEEWDEQWARIFEMPMGNDSKLPYAKQIVNAEMERMGNEVGRPLVMKVQVQVHEGPLNREALHDE